MKRLKSVLKRDKLRQGPVKHEDTTPSRPSSFKGSNELLGTGAKPSDADLGLSGAYRSLHGYDVTPLSWSENHEERAEILPQAEEYSSPWAIGPASRWLELGAQDTAIPFDSFGSWHSAGNARIPDEDLVGSASEAEPERRMLPPSLDQGINIQASFSEHQKRRRRASHNFVERQRRDTINDRIRDLSNLSPSYHKTSSSKLAVLEAAVNWTRDLMWAVKLKTQRETDWLKIIQNLGGTPFLPDTSETVEESVINREIERALETNNITSFSSTKHTPDRVNTQQRIRRASEPLQKHSIYDAKPQDPRTPRHLHKVTSRGSIISYVASVHSVTSLTYRSPTGNIETQTQDLKSSFSYFPDTKALAHDELAKNNERPGANTGLVIDDVSHKDAQVTTRNKDSYTPEAQIVRGIAPGLLVEELSLLDSQQILGPGASLPSNFVDANDEVATKRARNTIAARKFRKRRAEHIKELEGDNAKLTADVELWKSRAVSQGFDATKAGPNAAETATTLRPPVPEKQEKPLKFRDAMGRNFSFPFHLCNRWMGMEDLIKEAFRNIDIVGSHVVEGHYDLVDPQGDLILPSVWEKVVKPGYSITMHMWPTPEPASAEQPPIEAENDSSQPAMNWTAEDSNPEETKPVLQEASNEESNATPVIRIFGPFIGPDSSPANLHNKGAKTDARVIESVNAIEVDGSGRSPADFITQHNNDLDILGGRAHPAVDCAAYGATYLENGFVRLKWKCACNHPFQIDVLEHHAGAAIAAVQELSHHNTDNESGLDVQYPRPILAALSEKLIRVFRLPSSDNEVLPQTKPLRTVPDDSARAREESPSPEPDRYICVCFPSITYKKYLHHVDVNKAADDPQLFFALQRKYYDWKPLWRRVMTLRSLSRVEYFEFRVFFSNLVTIKDDWRDRFPQGHGPDEWSYTPTSRDMTPYLIDDVLAHYVHNPQCAKLGNYFWKRIPKKLFCQLECPDDKPFKVGWGLYFIEDFSQFYLMLMLVPVLVGGVAVAAWYCAHYGKSFADGATVASGFAAVVMYIFSVAQGWAKQKGSL